MEEKGTKEAALKWCDYSPGLPNAIEKLAVALLVADGDMSDEDRAAWASQVMRQHRRWQDLGWAGLPVDWKPTAKVKIPAVFAPIGCVYKNPGHERAEAVVTAIQAWQGEGRRDGLNTDHLRRYVELEPPHAPPPDKKSKVGPMRWKTPAMLFGVAELIQERLADLRAALHLDMPRDQVPSAHATIMALTDERDAALVNAAADREAKITAQASKRQTAHRLKLKNKAATDARKAEHKKMVGLNKEQRRKLMAKVKADRKKVLASLKAAAEAAAAKQASEQTANLRTKYERARAGRHEQDAKVSRKRLRDVQKLKASLKQLQAAVEEEPEEESEDESDQEESGDAAANSSRRDERGCYKALPDRFRVLVWAQLARRVPPSAINANISDSIGALSPEDIPKLPCERSINFMRSELTVASEAIAAFRVALSKRIISFGWCARPLILTSLPTPHPDVVLGCDRAPSRKRGCARVNLPAFGWNGCPPSDLPIPIRSPQVVHRHPPTDPRQGISRCSASRGYASSTTRSWRSLTS